MGKRERDEENTLLLGYDGGITEEEGGEDGFSFSFDEEDIFEPLSEQEEERGNDDDVVSNKRPPPPRYDETISCLEEEKEGFAAEFYRCGTDWSSLLLQKSSSLVSLGIKQHPPKQHCKQQQQPKQLKQANLFHMWGFSNNNKIQCSNATAFSSVASSSNIATTSTSNNTALVPHTTVATTSRNNTTRACPFYKKIPGTPFTVDAFRYGSIQGCSGYILSHFHADHYGGLTKAWSHGPIYCTPITARLLKLCLYVHPLYIHQMELDTEYMIEGIKVTLLEANHCPGAALIHLRLQNGQCILHTGDFRANKLMHQYPLLANQRVNVLYLDTTYCNQKYRFPAKEDVLKFVVKVSQNFLQKQPKTLIVVGAYSIGKECVYIAISKALRVKIHADSRRRRILQSFGWPELSTNLTPDGKETPLHVLPISSLKLEILERYLKTHTNRYTAVLAFRPTGWTYSESVGSHLDLIKPTSRGCVTIYGVPYSEHSSFVELEEFVKFLKPDKIIPTVNVGNAAHRDKMQSYFREWLKG